MLIILLAIIFGLLMFLFDALILQIVVKKLKVAELTYKKALIISIIFKVISSIFAVIIGAIFTSLIPNFLIYVLTAVASYFVFHKVFYKYFKTSLKASLKTYIVYQVISIILISAVSLAVIVSVRAFIFQPYYITGSAMSPTLNNHDYTFFKEFDKNYQRGDIIIHRDTKGGANVLVKRIIGLPGEKMQIKDGKVYIYNVSTPNGEALVEPYLVSNINTVAVDEGIITLGENQYYVLGDNRTASLDSRIYGPINKSLIIGKYWLTGIKN
jgi:signal peptidase I